MTEEHEELVLELVNGEFLATCLCGWVTEGYQSAAAASEAWENHCDVAFIDASEADDDLAAGRTRPLDEVLADIDEEQ